MPERKSCSDTILGCPSALASGSASSLKSFKPGEQNLCLGEGYLLSPKLTARNIIHKTIRYCSIGKSDKFCIENKE